ncbi:hypothetical protein J542_2140 [Acinetobacter baumannii 299505]|uniref:hypothetical protein n=1 Tax=Acinetobacter baumannii TaxID=470 RepID=UPI00044D9C5D|nr:hypothetical protein [Acinetobacter baumannii]EXB83184.1 hypothetical protein J542_2140 [Acinetobacter baumannii 299505]MCW1490556.1 hypothetical protein [Acinetobacter baumannii]
MTTLCFKNLFQIGGAVVLRYPIKDMVVRTVDETPHPQYVALDGYRHIYHTDFIRLATPEEIKVGYRIDHHILQFELSQLN